MNMKKNCEQCDVYQERYLAHQLRKKETLIKIMKKRHSERMFSDKPVELEKLKELVRSLEYVPSSCDRKAVSFEVITDRDKKALLGGMLVGGVGWIHRAPIIFLLKADPLAYKAGDEINYMPFLDAGVIVQQLFLMGTALGLKTAYVNPNIRPMNSDHFKKVFGDKIFCGAFAVGYKL